MRRVALPLLLGLFGAAAQTCGAIAEPAPEADSVFRLPGSTITLQIENDYFTGPSTNRDRH
jgi:hypothetical protein